MLLNLDVVIDPRLDLAAEKRVPANLFIQVCLAAACSWLLPPVTDQAHSHSLVSYDCPMLSLLGFRQE